MIRLLFLKAYFKGGQSMATINVRNTMRDYLRVLFRRWKVFTISFVVMVATVVAGLLFKTPLYESKVTMLILAKKQVNSLYYKEASEYPFTVMTVTQSEIVKSNPVMERVVKSLRLDEQGDDYESKYSSPLKKLIFDASRKSGGAQIELSPDQEKEDKEFRFRKAVEGLKKKVRVEPVRETDLFVILVRDYDPVAAAKIANTVSRSYCIFDLEQQLAELKQKYGEKHLFVIQLKDNISRMEAMLNGDTLPNIDAIGPASVKIIEQATRAVAPVGKSRKVMTILVVILGLFLGGILAFLADGLDSTIKDPQDVTNILRIPYIGFVARQISLSGKVPLIIAGLFRPICIILGLWLFVRFAMSLRGMRTEGNVQLELLIESLTMFMAGAFATRGAALLSRLWNATAFKKIRPARLNAVLAPYQPVAQKIYLSMKNNAQKSVAFVGVSRLEGVSTLASNVSSFLAMKMNVKVLLIDANLRAPSLHKIFGIPNTVGLSDVLGDPAGPLKNAAHVMENLDVIPAHTVKDEPVSILDSSAFIELIKKAEKHYDIILVDTPNLKNYQDATVLSSQVAAVVITIAEGQTRHEVLAASLAPLKDKKAPIMGAVLNKRSFAIPGFLYDRT
jgi:capsular exopolysaccharide synthesis family protein